MCKIYLLFVSFCIAQFCYSQCPVINGALINACAADGVTEGINEFVFFTTPETGAVSLYKLSYGSRNPPASQGPTGYLSGNDATSKNGPGSLIIQAGCTLHEVTSSSAVIPAGSSVVFIPFNFDQTYDLTGLCKNGNLYVVYINIDPATTTGSRWMYGGTMANAASSPRYIQIEYNGNGCAGNVRTYDGALWANPGNTPEADGNSLAWDAQNNITYLNNGCSIIVTPVKLVSFNAAKKGKDALLQWKTAGELNTKEFEVEWSVDGRSFKKIGNVKASGNTDADRHYSFTDKNVAAGNHFYRLRIVDNNGSFEYSPIAKLNFTGDAMINIYPTITHNNLRIELNAARQEATAALVFDHTGRQLLVKKIQLVAGYNTIELDVNNLPAGEYLLRLLTCNGDFISRFIKL